MLQTLDRGLRALNFVSLQPRGALVSEIAEELGVHRAIAYRIVSAPSSVISTGQISAASHPVSRSSSARVGTRNPSADRTWARWYSMVLPDHSYSPNRPARP